jgi:hypothetical protein
MLYDQERTADGFYNYASRRVPKTVTSLKKLEDVKDWVKKVCQIGNILQKRFVHLPYF